MSALALKTILPSDVRDQGIVKHYPKDNILHHQGDGRLHVCYILSGRVFATSINVDGEETWVSEFTAGQFLGSDSLFDTEPSNFQLVAKTPITGLLYPRESFLTLMNRFPELNNMVIADLARQISNFTTQTLESNSLSVHGRIASELKRQAKPIGREPGTFIIRPTPVFSELAQRMGSSRETVSRSVSKMVKNGILERRTGALIVPKIERLDDEIQ